MPETPQAPPEQEKQPPKPKEYILQFEPVGEFTETELFMNGAVRGKMVITDKFSVVMRSLKGTEVDAINKAVPLDPKMTVAHYQTEITYQNLAHAIESINGQKVEADIETRVKKYREMASALLTRLQIAYLEFNDHIEELFKGAESVKKS